ncbi:50S ribosomal protein L30e [Methanosarcinales archaeon ex4484_138]|nr:MAG: 50S ribosomal protein L30e [Methanosarcinales archaeon ex4484_138]
MVDTDKILRTIIKEGKVVIGAKETIQSVSDKTAKLVIVSSNCPTEVKEEIGMDNQIEYNADNIELGTACGKPFAISTLAILEADESVRTDNGGITHRLHHKREPEQSNFHREKRRDGRSHRKTRRTRGPPTNNHQQTDRNNRILRKPTRIHKKSTTTCCSQKNKYN